MAGAGDHDPGRLVFQSASVLIVDFGVGEPGKCASRSSAQIAVIWRRCRAGDHGCEAGARLAGSDRGPAR